MKNVEGRPVTSGAAQVLIDETGKTRVTQPAAVPHRPVRDRGPGWVFYGPVGRWTR